MYMYMYTYVPNVSDYRVCRLLVEYNSLKREIVENKARLERQRNLTGVLEKQIADEQEDTRQKTVMFEALQEENKKLQEREKSLEEKVAEDGQTIKTMQKVAVVFACISAAAIIYAGVVTYMYKLFKRQAKNSNKITDPEHNHYNTFEKQPLAEAEEADQTDDTAPKKIDDESNDAVVIINENTNYVAQPQVREEIEATPLQETQLDDEIPGTQNNRTFS